MSTGIFIPEIDHAVGDADVEPNRLATIYSRNAVERLDKEARVTDLVTRNPKEGGTCVRPCVRVCNVMRA